MSPNKHLGQNFLQNKEVLQRISKELEIKAGDTVIEIGPGHGELTQELLATNKKLTLLAIEKDPKLAKLVQKRFPQIELVIGNALKLLPKIADASKLKAINYKLCGNIPYYITGHFFRIIGNLENKPKLTVFTIQKEVAQRIVAKAPHTNLLAASIQVWAHAKIITCISKEDFSPIPKVDSAVLKLETIELRNIDLKNYYAFVRILFSKPRKTLWNNIRETPFRTLKRVFPMFGITEKTRSQELSIETLLELSKFMILNPHLVYNKKDENS